MIRTDEQNALLYVFIRRSTRLTNDLEDILSEAEAVGLVPYETRFVKSGEPHCGHVHDKPRVIVQWASPYDDAEYLATK